MSFGPDNAVKLFNKFVGSRDFRSAPLGITQYPDWSYRFRPDVVLDYPVDGKGTVVKQTMWQPANTGDVMRHFRDANILPPVFFIRTDHVIGIDMLHVLNARPGYPLSFLPQPAMPAPLGGLATTHFCIKWPGYSQEYRKQVELRDARHVTITMSKLVERVTSFVQRFTEEATNWPIDARYAHWRIGPGGFTKDHLFIVGLVHVSAGCWQVVLQLKGALNWPL